METEATLEMDFEADSGRGMNLKALARASQLVLKIVILSAGALLTGCASWLRSGKPVTYSDSLFVTMTFIEHVGEQPMQSYLAQNIHHPPVEKIREELETRMGAPLKNRGESHITVVTPVEYDNVLRAHLPIARINEIARDMRIQSLAFEPLCLGRGQRQIDGVDEQTYFIVVKAPQLFELRRKILAAYVAGGGEARLFDPDAFYPHITVGFTKRDLHFEEGVVKDERSCLFRLESAPR